MKVVLDTNGLIAAFIARGVCNELLEHCAIVHEIVVSPFILGELRDTLTRKFQYDADEVDSVVRLLASRCSVVAHRELSEESCRDSDDDKAIGTAVAGSCDC
jgi:putative PIN family toxin of toxin-antitoxin system